MAHDTIPPAFASTSADPIFQQRRREELYGLLGDVPPRDRPIRVLAREINSSTDYVLEELLLDLNGVEPVPAYFVKPRNATGRLPVVLYNHSHGGRYGAGKKELLEGAPYLHSPYAAELTGLGYAALCIDQWAFGQRSSRAESHVFKQMLWDGQVMWGMMTYDGLRAVDYLASRDDIDSQCIATLGISMGSTMAWWLAALDQRIKLCIDLCCMTDFQALVEAGELDAHGIFYYVPSLLKHFTTAQINELIVPRAHLCCAGDLDILTPTAGLDRIDRQLQQAYAAAGAPQHWKMWRENVGHQETATMRGHIVRCLEQARAGAIQLT